MKDRRISLGIVLLAIGIVGLLLNLGIIGWSLFDTLFDYWPAIFIVIGINIIFRHNEIVKAATWLVFIGAIIALSYYNNGSIRNNRQWIKGSEVKIEKPVETEAGEVKIQLGGTRLNIGSTDLNLVDASLSDPDIGHSVTYDNNKKNASVQFARNRNFIINNNGREYCSFNLNEDVLWKLDIDTGAVSGTFDMSNLMVEDVDLDTGAASLNLIFGDRCQKVNVDIDAGASSIDITVPKDAGVKIKKDGVFSNSNINGLDFDREGDIYISKNYDTSKIKINFDVDMGAGSFNMNVK